MAGNYSFSLQGATPFQPQGSTYGPALPGSTSKSKALNNVQLGGGLNTQTNTSTPAYASGGVKILPTIGNWINKGNAFSGETVNNPVIPSSPSLSTTSQSSGLLPPTDQPVKSHTITNVDGSTTSQTYHPPATTTQSSSSQTSGQSSNSGMIQNSPLNSATSGLVGLGSGGGSDVSNKAQNNLSDISTGSGLYRPTIDQSSSGLLDISKNQTPEVKEAQKQYSDFSKASPYLLSDVRNNPNVAAEVSVGRGQALGQTLSAEQQALSSNVANALAGEGQQITAANDAGGLGINAQGQQITAGTNAGNMALTGRGQNVTALSNAGNLNQPVSQFGVLGQPGSVHPFGANGGSAAFQGGFIGGQQAAGQNAAGMNVANTAAKGIQGTIQQYLQDNPQLNSSASTIANAAQQWITGKQLGDPTYQTLFNYLNEYISTLAPILGVGGDTTNLKTEIAQSFINAKASGQSISQVLNSIGKLADDKYQNIVSAGQGGGQVAGGIPHGGTPTSFSTEW